MRRLSIDKTGRPRAVPCSPMSRITTRKQKRSALRIENWWICKRNMRPANQTLDYGQRGFLRVHSKNVICPITQDAIQANGSFKLVSESGHVHAFDATAIAKYFETSGNFCCPCTRQPVNLVEIRRLSKITGEEVRRAFFNRLSLRTRSIERDYRVLAIENTCGNVMTEMIDVCTDFDLSMQEASTQIENFLIPEWKDLVEQFLRYSVEDCKAMLLSDLDKLHRLERSEISDPHGLLSAVKDAVYAKIRVAERVLAIRSRMPTRPFFNSTTSERLRESIALLNRQVVSGLGFNFGVGFTGFNFGGEDFSSAEASSGTNGAHGGGDTDSADGGGDTDSADGSADGGENAALQRVANVFFERQLAVFDFLTTPRTQ